jgi:lysophospholipase L1-like esterase
MRHAYGRAVASRRHCRHRARSRGCASASVATYLAHRSARCDLAPSFFHLLILRAHNAWMPLLEGVRMKLNNLRLVGGAASYVALGLLVSSCGGSSGSASSTVSIVGGAPVATSTPTPAATSTNVATPAGIIVQAGDSIGAGVAANWAALDHLGFPASVIVHNVSVSGLTMASGYSERNAQIFPFRSYTSPSVLLIQQGTNDLYAGMSAKKLYQSTLQKFVSSAHSAGFYVVVDTILPRADGGWNQAMEVERNAYNQLVRVNTAKADGINDLAADPVIGDATDPATSSYYADRIHPSLAGQQRLAELDASALKAFLLLPVHGTSK